MSTVWIMALKDLKLLVRDRQGLFFALGFPLVFAVFFGMLFSGMGGGGKGSGMSIVIVDDDNTPGSARLIAQLEGDDAFNVSKQPARDAAQDLVRTGKKTAMVVIPKGFGAAGDRIFWGDPMKLLIGVDPARKAEAGMIEGMLTAKAYQRFQDLFTDRDAMRKNTRDALAALNADPSANLPERAVLQTFLGSLDRFVTDLPPDDKDPGKLQMGGGFNPVSIEKLDIVPKRSGPDNSFAITFPQAMLWGIMGCAASFGISIVTERSRGTLVRLHMAPLSGAKILGGKGLACMLATLTVFTLLIGLAHLPPFNVRPGSWPLLIMAALSVAFGFVGIMMILSVLGKTERAAGGIGWAAMTIMSMIGGGMVPLFVLPPIMQKLSNVSPVKWSILALEGAIWRGFSFQQMLLPCGIMVGIGLAGMFLGSRGMGASRAA